MQKIRTCNDIFMEIKVRFFEILQERLEGVNLAELSRELEISSSLLHDWARSKRYPTLKNADAIKKLANYLGLEFEELVLGQAAGTKDKILTSVFFEDENKKYQIQIKRLK